MKAISHNLPRFVLLLVAAAAAAIGVAGCGHKATADECQFLVDRSVELTFKEIEKDASVEELAQAQETQRKQLASDMKDSCQGRKITDAMMKCARAAQTTDELEACIK